MVILALAVIYLVRPNVFVQIDKALSGSIVQLETLSLPYRIVLGVGLFWLGFFFLRTLPSYLAVP